MKSSKKRSLSLLVAFCMLCMSMVSMAFADEATALVSVEVTVDEDANTATMDIIIPEGEIAGGKFIFTFDTEHLTYVSGTEGSTGSVVINDNDGNPTDGQVITNFASSKATSGTQSTFVFSLVDGTFDPSWITFTYYSVSSIDGTIETSDTVIPTITVSVVEATTEEPTTEEATTEEATTEEATTEEATTEEATTVEETTTATATDNDASETGDTNYVVFALFAMVALVGCVAAKKKAIF